MFIIILSACSGNLDQTNQINQDTWGLVKTDSILIKLDATQGFFKIGYSQFNYKNKLCLSLFNQLNGVIKYYDIKNDSIFNVIKLERDGENGIESNLSQTIHHVINYDSLLVLSDWEKKIYLLNKDGEKINEYDLLNSEVYNNEGPIIFTMTNDNRPVIVNNKLFLNCEYLEYSKSKDQGVLLSLDLETGVFNTSINPPKTYFEDCWGIAYSLNVFHSRLGKGDSVLFSFGIDPNLYLYARDSLLMKKPVPSKYIKNLRPWSSNYLDYKDMSTWQKRRDHSVLGAKYYKTLYLKDQKMILRETFLDRSEEEFVPGISGLKKSIMLIDKNFNHVGEHIWPTGEYFTSNYILSNDGVYVANYSKYLANEDMLQLDKFVPYKK